MEAKHRKARRAVQEFLRRQDRRSYARMIRVTSAWCSEGGADRDLEADLRDAVLLAAESPDWRVAAQAIPDMELDARRALARRADIVASGLVSRYESVRQSSWPAVDGLRLARLVLDRLEARPIREVMVWEVLMAVDNMLRYLIGAKDRDRVARFVKRMESLVGQLPRGKRSSLLAWKIDQTMHAERFLNMPREEE